MSFDPLTLAASLALTAGGTALQNRASNAAEKQRVAKLRAQRQRNEAFRKRSSQQFENSLDRFRGDKPRDDMDDIKQTLTEAFQGVPGSGASSAPGMRSAAGQEALQGSLAGAKAKTDARGSALANMRSLGDMLFANNISLNRGNQAIGANAFNTRSSNVALPFELDAAMRKAQSPIGDILVAGGSSLGGSGFGSGEKVNLANLFRRPGPTSIIPAGLGAV